MSNSSITAGCPLAPAEATSTAYRSYLGLSGILASQAPRSQSKHELLFIVQHQVSELWLKLILHELQELRGLLRCDALAAVHKSFGRVIRVMEQLVSAWDVLATLSPSEYVEIRPSLGRASGFQSIQYRQLEFLLGNKNADLATCLMADTQDEPELRRELALPSLYDEVVSALARAGFAISADRLARDHSLPTLEDASVTQAWVTVYKQVDQYPDLYAIGERLVDLEASFRLWRFRHLTTVERVIGTKPGTGGTSGTPYLRRMLQVVLFPELFSLRSQL